MSRDIYVFADWQPLGAPQLMGLLRAELVHGTETFSFEYSREWLESDNVMSLDPELQLFQTDQDFDNDDEAREWLRLLMAPGSSIGGARPKAGVCDFEHL